MFGGLHTEPLTSPYPRFSTIHETSFIFFTKTIPCGTMSVPIVSRHIPTNTPARGARGQSWEGDCPNRQSGAPQGACVLRYIRGLVG